ncbi:MAG: hypothetical protein LBQ57_13165 [Spirochaetales bacterium]|jgi:hypothetical protein|nr:hypothetical protein [Spirochaetales bacterium]
MIRSTIFRKFLFAGFAAAALFFMGCTDGDDDGDDLDDYSGATEFSITLTSGQTKYFDFENGGFTSASDGVDADSAGNQNWDIAFAYARMLYTNSGATATSVSSGGAGGVWYIGKTFKNLTTLPALEDSPYPTDTTKYVSSMAQSGPVTNGSAAVLNTMTYIGYGSGDGESSNAFWDYKYNAKQFYHFDLSAAMPPPTSAYSATKNVYIIKNGAGNGYIELQISDIETPTSGPRTFKGYYQTLP